MKKHNSLKKEKVTKKTKPNKITLNTFKDSEARKNLKTFKSIKDLLKDLKR